MKCFVIVVLFRCVVIVSQDEDMIPSIWSVSPHFADYFMEARLLILVVTKVEEIWQQATVKYFSKNKNFLILLFHHISIFYALRWIYTSDFNR